MEQKENVVIEAGDCAVTLLPHLGGKISSLRVRGKELLQKPLRPYATRTKTMDFADGDASGWDECLPSVAGCAVNTVAGSVNVPDHGDLWRIPWQILAATEDAATLRATCFSLPLEMTRTLLLMKSDSGWRLQLLYSLTNLSDHPVPWLWSAHPGFAVEAGDRIVLPKSVESLRLEGSRKNRLGVHGDQVTWPLAKLADGTQRDLGIVLDPEAGTGDKLFAGPMQENWCALERPSAGVRLTMSFEPAITPYLGLWICYGGWPDRPGDDSGPRQMCVAMEPTTAPVDSLAEVGDWTRTLAPGAMVNWPIELRIEPLGHP